MTRREEIIESFKISEFDELNTLRTIKTVDELKKNAKDHCFDAFLDAYIGVYYILEMESGLKAPTTEEIYAIIDAAIAGKTMNERLEEYAKEKKTETYADSPEIASVILTEAHRCYCEGQMRAATEIDESGEALVYKKWNAILDDVTRDSHFQLNGTTIPLGEYFVSGADKALAPGLFTTASENANCRCILDIVAYKPTEN